MNNTLKTTAALALLALLGACTVMPTGPSVMAMPGHGKSFDAFKLDNETCKSWANEQAGGQQADHQSTLNAVGPAVIGAGLGAAAGAGMAHRDPGAGAAAGAGLGLLAGAMFGVNNAAAGGASVQRRYDMAYMQCMSAKGEQIPPQAIAAPVRTLW